MLKLIAIVCTLVCCAAACFATKPMPARPTPQPRPYYAPEYLQANGSARYEDGGIARLTNNTVSEISSLFLKTPVDVRSFDTAFSFLMSGGSEDHADGLTFCIQNDPRGASAIGAAGGYLGYGLAEPWNTPGITKSVAVEFDDYFNEPFSDLPGDHVGIDLDSSVVSRALAASPVPLFGGVVNARITYGRGCLSVYVWTGDRMPRQPLLRQMVDIPAALGARSGFVGFTSGTATYFQYTDVLSWTFGRSCLVPVLPSERPVVPLDARPVPD